ncbi:ABC transporter permease [Carboxydochorda subterranea]|uniref:ABC transporter permease n=1 Tax=Carboxydichorda subterranea TaxID=3109565 RepID=A0ABZ1BW41_9FIRM|nr:ABC transporter permease [Limnochorda sp. L945t]WRP17020.1 ABC transporter permease [Limnochorda sp. L945t]
MKARGLQAARAVAVPVLAVVTGLVVGAVIIVVTDLEVLRAWAAGPARWGAAAAATWHSVARAYGALWEGALGSPYAVSESLITATPYILAGLAVALGFRAGLFNIGVEGQLFAGALASVWVGYAVRGMPAAVHLPLALLAGAGAGAVWAAIPGYLKARTGAHEVVNTIMMNYVAFRLSDWLLNGPMKRPGPGGSPGFVPVSPEVLPSAYLPQLFAPPIRFHVGFFLALAIAAVVWWLLWRTPLGFELRSVGVNPSAARTAGISVERSYVVAMTISGALAGLAGANQVLGVDHWLGQGFSPGYGFDSIALALLGGSHPVGVILASLLFGTLRSGATRMQSVAGIPIDIITILQALIIAFVAAPALIRALYRLRTRAEAGPVLTRGWGKG